MRGKPQKKYPRSQGRGRGKRDDRKPRDRDEGKLETTEGKELSEVDPVNDQESGKYGRKKIESNWDRYEEPEIDEHAIVVDDYDETKDFEYIRQISASASSHFKFKEEKEWENDIQQAGKDDKSVLGLNLMQLAADLEEYQLDEKLGINSIVPEECKYCVKDIFQHVPSNPTQVKSFHNELSRSFEKIQWSFDGIEKYKYLIGLTPENDEVNRIVKPQINNAKNSPNRIIYNTEKKNISAEQVNSKNVTETQVTSVDPQEDSSVLDELLMGKLLIDSNERLDCFESLECTHTKNIDGKLEDHHNSLEKQVISQEMNGHCDSSVVSVINSHTVAEDDSMNKSDELDLDMLLECDILSPVSGSNDGKNVDGDLDQWLDDMLT